MKTQDGGSHQVSTKTCLFTLIIFNQLKQKVDITMAI